MSKISPLSPAELMFLASPNHSNGEEMMRVHITHLIITGVIQLEKTKDPIKNGVGTMNHFHVSRGINFESHVSQSFENYFLYPFREQNKRLPLGVYALFIIGKYKNGISFKKEQIYPSLLNKKLLKPKFLSIFHQLTKEGENAQNQIKNGLTQWRKEIKPSFYYEFIQNYGSLFILIEDINWKILEEIRLDVLQQVLDKVKETEKTNSSNKPFLNFMMSHLANEKFSFLSLSENYYDHIALGFETEM